jgi:hypothetical protein
VCCLLSLVYTCKYVIYIMHMLLKIPYYFFVLPYCGRFQGSTGFGFGFGLSPKVLNQGSGRFWVLSSGFAFVSTKAPPIRICLVAIPMYIYCTCSNDFELTQTLACLRPSSALRGPPRANIQCKANTCSLRLVGRVRSPHTRAHSH